MINFTSTSSNILTGFNLQLPQFGNLNNISILGLLKNHSIWTIFFLVATLLFLINYAFTVYHLKTFGIGWQPKILNFIFSIGSLAMLIFFFAALFFTR